MAPGLFDADHAFQHDRDDTERDGDQERDIERFARQRVGFEDDFVQAFSPGSGTGFESGFRAGLVGICRRSHAANLNRT